MFKADERAQWIDFSEPLHEVKTAVYFRAGRDQPQPLKEMAGEKVATVKGFYQEAWLRKNHPDLQIITFANASELVLAVLKGDVKASVLEVPSVEAETNRLGLRGALVRSPESVFANFMHAGVRKGETALLEAINDGFGNVDSSRLNDIERLWLPSPRDHYYAGAAGEISLTPEEEAWIGRNPVVRFAVTNFINPVDVVLEDGTYTGLNADLIKLLNRKLGLNIVPEIKTKWGDVVDSVMNGTVEAGFSLSRTPEREEKILFTAPYAYDSMIALVRQAESAITSWDDLTGKNLSVTKGMVVAEMLRGMIGGGSLTEVESEEEGLRRLADGDFDAHVAFLIPYGNAQRTAKISGLRIAVTRNLEGGSLRIGVSKKHPELFSIIRKGLNATSRREMTDIRNRWLYPDRSDQAGAVSLTAEERAWILANPVLKVAATGDWPPFESRAPTGAYAGITADFMRKVAERTGLKLDVVFGPWGEHLDMLRRGELDVAPGLYQTRDREEFMLFTRPFVEIYDTIFSRADRSDIASMIDLAGKTVALEKDYAVHEMIKDGYPDIKIMPVVNALEALKAVTTGQADAYIGNQVVANYLIDENLLPNLKMVGYFALEPNFLTMGVPKGRSILRGILQKGLDSITTRERKRIIGSHVTLGQGARTRTLDMSEEEEEWLDNHRKIRVHNELDWPPFNFNEGSGPKGFSIAFMDLLAKKLGIEIEYVSGPSWNEFLAMIRDKQGLDVMLNIVLTPDREKYISFTDPYVENPSVIVRRKGERGIERLEDLFGKTVAIPKGYFYQEVIERDFPQINLLLLKDQAESLKAVAFRKAAATIGGIADSNYLIRKNALAGLEIAGEIQERAFANPLRIGVRDDWPILRDLLQRAARSLTLREETALYDEYLGAAAGRLELTAEERAWLKKHPVVRLAGESNWPPFEFRDSSGAYSGISVDLLRRVANIAGFKFEPVFGKWAEVLGKLKPGEVEMSAGLMQTPERDEFLTFTTPIAEIFYSIIVKSGTSGIRGMADLDGKKVAIEDGYALHERLRSEHPDIDLVVVGTTLEALERVVAGEVDAYVGNQLAATYLIGKHTLPNLRTAGYFSDQPDLVRMGVNKQHPELVSILNKALDRISEPERREIRRRWVAHDPSQVPLSERLELDDGERAWLKQKRELRIGIDREWAPFEFFDKQGAYSGVAASFMETIGRALRVKTTPVKKLDFGLPVNRLLTGEVDVIAAIVPQQKYEAILTFTKPYLSFPVVIAMREDATSIDGIDDLAGLRVGVVLGHITGNYLRRDHKNLKIKPMKSVEDALTALSTGAIDAFVDNVSSVTYGIQTLGLGNLKVAAPTPYTHDLAMAVNANQAELIGLLNKVFDSMTEAEKSDIKNRWIALEYDLGLDWITVAKWAAPVVAVALVIIVNIVTANRRMRREIADRIRAEKRLQFTQYAVDNAVEGVFWVRVKDGGLEYVNEAACRNLGYGRDELMAMDVADIDLNFKRERIPVVVGELKKTHNLTFESQHRAKDGRLIDVEITVYLAEYDDRELLVANAKDITERKKAEQDLAEQKKILELTLETMDQSISMVDAELTMVAYNRKLFDMFELPEEMYGKTLRLEDLFRITAERGEYGPGDPEEQIHERIELSRKFEAHHFERERPDGRVLEIRGVPVPGGGMVSTYTDITDRKRAEEALQRTVNELDAVMDTIQYGVLFMDGDTRTRVMNRAFQEMWGMDQAYTDTRPTFEEIVEYNRHNNI